jgi:tetratricopeptide (TPR) repeat protein
MFADPDATVALSPAPPTVPLAGAGPTVRLRGQTGTVSLPAGSATSALASAEEGIGPVDPAITTAEPGEEAAITELRDAVARDPNDADALFKLSIVLHRAEQTDAARATLTRLAKVYEARGQSAQANRILGMLSSPKTGPIATEDLPPRPKMKTGSLTGPLAGFETGRLGLTGALGRAAKDTAAKPVPPAFPPEALTFTVPLPGEEELPEPVRAAILQSTDDLMRGRLHAAFDACVWAVYLDDGFYPAFIRMAEINTALRQRRRARSQAESLVRLLKAEGEDRHLWMVYRILLHTAENDLPSLRRLVELLIEAERTDLASYYASKLIQLLDQEGLTDEAIAYSARLRSLIPGDTRAALENAILRVKGGDPNGAVELWEEAVAAGADPVLGKASLAAVVAGSSHDDHWRILADVATALRERKDRAIVDAYARTAAVMPPCPELVVGQGVLLANLSDPTARDLLAGVVADRGAPPLAKAIGAVALSRLAQIAGPPEEFVASVRTSLKFLEDPEVANHPSWGGLIGITPRYEELSIELGTLLLERQDAAGAVDVLKTAKVRASKHERVCELLAEAYFKTGQLASALTVLDELVGHHRGSGQLEEMAAVLRQMSQLAPNNIKVKTRLIDTYLQRGFVAEARAELIQRADLEERSGLIHDAIASLVRAAELSWTTGMADETFALYKRVIEMQPAAVEHRHGVVAYYLQLHRTAEAAEHQRAIVDISLREGRRHEAIAALHQVIGLTPDDTSAYYQLGDLLSSVGEYGQAERVYRRILALQPDDPIAQAKATAMAALKEQRGR